MDRQSIIPRDLNDLILRRDWPALGTAQSRWPDYRIAAPELAPLFDSFSGKESLAFLRALPPGLGVEVLSHMDLRLRDPLILSLTEEEIRSVLAAMSPDDRSEFLNELPGAATARMVALLNPEDREEADRLLSYPEESVGRMMTPDYMTLSPDWTVRQVLDHLRRFGEDRETLSMLYVIDRSGVLLDAVSLNRLVLSPPGVTVRELMDNSAVRIPADEDREEAVRIMQTYDRLVLPVVDRQNRLQGIVTIDDVMDIAEEEVTEDFQLQAAVHPLGKGYWDSGLFHLFRSRVGWLAVLILVNLISSGIIAAFEDSLASYVALAFFIPLLIDTGGNSGSQSAMLMIRALSTGDVRMNQWFRTFLRELCVGTVLGVCLGGLGFLLGWYRGGFELALVVFLSLTVIMIITNLIGMILPFLLTRFRVDPAVASGPLITTVSDAAGLLIYFGFARLILPL